MRVGTVFDLGPKFDFKKENGHRIQKQAEKNRCKKAGGTFPPAILLKSRGCFDLSFGDLVWKHVPEPNCEDSVVNGHDPQAHRESAGRFSKP